jgi:aminoglycoside 6'-N-acetyltransferase
VKEQVEIRIRPLEHDDLPLIARWLREPHVDEWWDGPYTLEDVTRKYSPRIERDHHVRCYLALDSESPIGFVQCYRIGDEPEYAPGGELDPEAIGIDLYIGASSHLGRGAGSRILDTFVSTVVFADPGVPYAVIDPDTRNGRAIRSYRRAGFADLAVLERPDETVLLMRRDRPVYPG